MSQEMAFDLKQQARCMCSASTDNAAESRWLTASVAARNEVHLQELSIASSEVTSQCSWSCHGDVRHIACKLGSTQERLISAVVRRPGVWNLALWRCAAGAECVEQAVQSLGSDVQQTSWNDTDSDLLLAVAETSMSTFTLGDSVLKVAASTRNMPAGSELLCGRFQPGSTNVVVAGSQTAWHVWDTRSAEQPQSHDAAGQMAIQALDISASAAHLLATGSRDGRVCLWDLRKGVHAAPLLDIAAHSHWVWSVGFNPQYSQLLATAGSDGVAHLWHLPSYGDGSVKPSRSQSQSTAAAVMTVKHPESVYHSKWSAVDPWLWASLSFDGHVVLSRVPAATRNSLKF